MIGWVTTARRLKDYVRDVEGGAFDRQRDEVVGFRTPGRATAIKREVTWLVDIFRWRHRSVIFGCHGTAGWARIVAPE